MWSPDIYAIFLPRKGIGVKTRISVYFGGFTFQINPQVLGSKKKRKHFSFLIIQFSSHIYQIYNENFRAVSISCFACMYVHFRRHTRKIRARTENARHKKFVYVFYTFLYNDSLNKDGHEFLDSQHHTNTKTTANLVKLCYS